MDFFGLSATLSSGFFLFALLIAVIFFLAAQQNTIEAIQPKNRVINPGLVWLQLIPLFNFVWCFIVTNRLSKSIEREFSFPPSFSFEENETGSNLKKIEEPTNQVGMAMCVFFCLSFLPYLGQFMEIAALICWIIYWVRITNCRKKIENSQH